MKSFKDILTESKNKSQVLLFGRMNPPTAGHEENVTQAHKLAQKHGAELNVVASHSHDPKKNPLSPAQKNKHLKRAFGHLSNTKLGTSSSQHPSILHHAALAHAAGVRHLVLAGGGDRADSHYKLLKQYNGVKGKAHGFYHFDKITKAMTGARREGISGTALRQHAHAGNFDAFKKHLPSKIVGNEKHAKELFAHVRGGLTKSESYNREDFMSDNILHLGQPVLDSHTGLSGTIVYRGPTYVTIQVNEELSFKRWAQDIDESLLPADLKQHHLQRLDFCPSAVKLFDSLLDDQSKDQSLVQVALDKTAHYLNIEEYISKNLQALDDHTVSAFVLHMRDAAQALKILGVLDQHEAYMEQHAHAMMNFMHGQSPEPREESMKNFKNYVIQEAQEKKKDTKGQTKVAAPGDEVGEHLTDDDLRAIERHIDQMEDEDFKHILDKQEHEEMEEEWDFELEEEYKGLTAAQRIKKRMIFLKGKAKRNIARKIALKRVAPQAKLKRRAIVTARKMIMKRLFRGRDKSKMSPAEKSRIEGVLRKLKPAVVRISNRIIPKLRELEKKRLAHQYHKENIDKMVSYTDPKKFYDAEEHASETVAQNDTDTANNPRLAFNKAGLEGQQTIRNQAADSEKQLRKTKHFRKLEV